MPFRLSNPPATFQRLADCVIGADLQPSVYIYLDDIVIVSHDFTSHLKTLDLVLQRLHDAGLNLSATKCAFCKPQLKYLGFLVDRYGLRPDPEKIQNILNVPAPKDVAAVRRFIGMSSWYRRFVPNFATIISPLTQLTRKNAKFNWTTECDEAFRNLKECLVTSPVLPAPEFNRSFVLQTDASAFGIGTVLTQTFEDGEHVFCFLSRSLTRQERNYSTTER